MAAHIQKEVAKVFTPNRGVKAGWYRQDRPGIRDYAGDVDGDEKPLYFLQKTNCPAVILEPEFMHRIREIQAHMDMCCTAIAVGISNAFNA